MKQFLVLSFLLLSSFGVAQTTAVRFGDGEPVTASQALPGFSNAFLVVNGPATINFCLYPANAVPCTNLATTFTAYSAVTQCSQSTQIVLDGTTSCVSQTDANGRWGVWALPGQYAYTVTYQGVSSGPYYATLGGSSSGGTLNPTPGAANDILASNGSGGFVVDTGKITLNPTTHFINAYGLGLIGATQMLLTGVPQTTPCTAGPAGQIQFAYCPGPLASLSYGGDGPFTIQRYGTIGQTLLVQPSNSYIPLDANNTLPLGALGDVGLLRVNPGVLGIVDSTTLSAPTRLNVYGPLGFTTNTQVGFFDYCAGLTAFCLGTDVTGSGQAYAQLDLCIHGQNCNGWGISGGSTSPGNLFPLSGNTNGNLGAIGNQVNNILLQGAVINSGQYTETYSNDSTGTLVGGVAKRSNVQDSNNNLEATAATTSDVTNTIGIVIGESTGGTCGVGSNCTTGVAFVAVKGHYNAAFDGSTTTKHWAIVSTTTAPDLTDSGLPCAGPRPQNVDVAGCISGTNSGAGVYPVDLDWHAATSQGVQSCGTTSTCSHTALTSPLTVIGKVALVSGTPSTVTVSGISPAFTSSSTFFCTANDNTTPTNGVKILPASGSSFTITGPNTVSDVISYICTGN